MKSEDIERTVQAIGAIALIRDHYSSSEEGQKRCMDILDMLRADGSNLFRANMADAIAGYLSNKSVELTARKAA